MIILMSFSIRLVSSPQFRFDDWQGKNSEGKQTDFLFILIWKSLIHFTTFVFCYPINKHKESRMPWKPDLTPYKFCLFFFFFSHLNVEINQASVNTG